MEPQSDKPTTSAANMFLLGIIAIVVVGFVRSWCQRSDGRSQGPQTRPDKFHFRAEQTSGKSTLDDSDALDILRYQEL